MTGAAGVMHQDDSEFKDDDVVVAVDENEYRNRAWNDGCPRAGFALLPLTDLKSG